LSDHTIYDFEILTGGRARRQPDAVSSGRRPQMGARGRRQLEDSLLQGRHRETAIVRQDLIARRLDQVYHRGLILFLVARRERDRRKRPSHSATGNWDSCCQASTWDYEISKSAAGHRAMLSLGNESDSLDLALLAARDPAEVEGGEAVKATHSGNALSAAVAHL